MPTEPSPASGAPITLAPSTRISTNMQTMIAIILATAVTVGGLVSVKADIATALKLGGDAAKEASDARKVVEDIRNDLYKIRLEINAISLGSQSSNRKAQP